MNEYPLKTSQVPYLFRRKKPAWPPELTVFIPPHLPSRGCSVGTDSRALRARPSQCQGPMILVIYVDNSGRVLQGDSFFVRGSSYDFSWGLYTWLLASACSSSARQITIAVALPRHSSISTRISATWDGPHSPVDSLPTWSTKISRAVPRTHFTRAAST